MQRATHSAVIARLDAASWPYPAGARERETSTGPSYVQSILFGRRWTRGPIPASSMLPPPSGGPGTRMTTDGKAGVANEQERT